MRSTTAPVLPPDESPHSDGFANGFAVIGAAVLGLIGTVVCVFGAGAYGWALFVLLPLCIGFVAGSMAAVGRQPPGVCATAGLGTLAALVTGVGLLATGLEGLVCLIMAIPLWLPLAAFGGVLGWALVHSTRSKKSRALGPMIVLIVLPAAIGAEYAVQLEPPEFQVTSAVEIDAPPQRVWRHVVNFGQLPEPTEFVFRSGVAYPIRAEIRGQGVGAERHCVFNTGAFVEPIDVWDEPRLLSFSVIENPPPMHELSPYPTVHAPHLHGFFVSRRGQFRLVELANGRTRLEGATWYQHHMWPAGYWQYWSDWIIHQIHLRVLNHVKQLAERDLG